MEGEWKGKICLVLFEDIEGAHSNNDGRTLDLPMSQGGSTSIAKADGPNLGDDGETQPVPGAWPVVERKIQGYNEESTPIGMQEFTARTPFPKVIVSFPICVF
jgi:hypothetical protein